MSQHNAPSVIYPLGRSRLQGQILLVLWVLSCVFTGYWVVVAQAFGWQQGVAAASVLLAVLALFIGWKNSPVGQLMWDGQHWHWQSLGYQSLGLLGAGHGGGAANNALSVIFDFQSVLLLRVENPAHAAWWLWAEKRTQPERWLDMRRAVFSPNRAHKTALIPA